MRDEVARALERCTAARGRAVQWLLSGTNPDGSIGPVEESLFYFRLPWALAVSGEAAATSRVLAWISRYQFTSDGRMEGVSPLGRFHTRFYTYPVSILVIGAHLAGRYDIGYAGYRYLRTRQNPESGGFYDAAGPIGPAAEEDVVSTAQAGLTALLLGDLETARRAATWFADLWELQPRLPERLFWRRSSVAGPITQFLPEDAFWYVVEAEGALQAYYAGGIAAAFLGRAYQATGERPYLELAHRYQDFAMRTTERQFETMQVCKSGWGSAVLYEATGKPLYRAWTLRLADWFVDTQFPDGHWENTPHWTPAPTPGENIKITAEFVVHLDTIVRALSSREG